jgi:hypothetical protein
VRLVRQHPQLGSGEVESFVLAQTHHLLCLTNDRQAKAVAQRLSLLYLDLEEILRALKTKAILATEAPPLSLTRLNSKIARGSKPRKTSSKPESLWLLTVPIVTNHVYGNDSINGKTDENSKDSSHRFSRRACKVLGYARLPEGHLP